MLNSEISSSNSFRDTKKHFVTAAAAAAEADIDDSIKRKKTPYAFRLKMLAVSL